MEPQADRYKAFLLRVWVREQGEGLLSSVQDVETGETHVFAELDQLGEWLRATIGGNAARPATPPAETTPR